MRFFFTLLFASVLFAADPKTESFDVLAAVYWKTYALDVEGHYELLRLQHNGGSGAEWSQAEKNVKQRMEETRTTFQKLREACDTKKTVFDMPAFQNSRIVRCLPK